ncbi:hydrolase [Seiridium cupressi]
MIYSHTHDDHYMGAQGVVSPDQDMSIPIITSEGFIGAIMSENILAGPAHLWQILKQRRVKAAATTNSQQHYHVVAANSEDSNPGAKLLLASAYEKLGYGAENATRRNFYLTGVQELRTGKKAGMVAGSRTSLGPNLTIDQHFDVMSVQPDGERASETSFGIDFDVMDVKQK